MDRSIEFTRECRDLHNVSSVILARYTHVFKWLPPETRRQDELKDVVMRMREKGLKKTPAELRVGSYIVPPQPHITSVIY
ncbi:MAG: hypothetical protein WA700_07390 [Acidobacteriaceae bacterium]